MTGETVQNAQSSSYFHYCADKKAYECYYPEMLKENVEQILFIFYIYIYILKREPTWY